VSGPFAANGTDMKDGFALYLSEKGNVLAGRNVELIVELVHWNPEVPFERLGIDLQARDVLGKALPLVRIPVAPGRNIPTLIEVAARNLLLQRMGYFSAEEFSRSLTAQIAMESARQPAGDREGGEGV